MSLNTQIPPFDDPKVRRALNFAVDRKAIEEVVGGTARLTCQVLPPNFPGYVPYCPYSRHPDGTWTAPDPAMAKRLVGESGNAGSRVTVWATPDAYVGLPVPVGRYFVDVLHELGYRATLKVVAGQKYFPAIYDPSGHVQMAFVGWVTDYPAESGYIVPTLTCDSTSNDSHFCDPGIDMRMDEAARLQITDPPTAHELWSSIEHDIVDLAPWVPLANRSWVNLVSERLGNFQLHPQWGPLVDQMWVR
jgi:peptide/nickel transport system substrate-binding protein